MLLMGIDKGEYWVYKGEYWYLGDLFFELNNIKAGCYIGEVLLNHFTFADDIWVLCPSVRALQNILDVCQDYADSHKIIFNRSKTVCMTSKAKTAKSTIVDIECTKSKICFPLQMFGVLLDIELSDDTDVERQTRYQYCAVNKLQASFCQCSAQWKMYFFVPSVGPCMHHNYGVILGRRTSTDCVWPVTLVAGRLYNLLWRASASSHLVQCNSPTSEAILK